MTDSDAYLERKKRFAQMLTIYGRNTVYEALSMVGVKARRLHLASSNKKAKVLDDIEAMAVAQGAEVLYHDKQALSRISKNSKQDQGVALDIHTEALAEFDAGALESGEYIALDRVTNPQNLGMIIRSVCASPIKALILPRKGCAKLDALVIKASAGSLFRCPILRCDHLVKSLTSAQQCGAIISGLDLNANANFDTLSSGKTRIFVLGNESEGISKELQALCDERLRITMARGVESLNVAVTASLIAFRTQL
ncbi:TrmH family RNA methyltransferase [Agaribacterium haliotis]|uniref:TrmH family RNA methyltransferase n=1 Tax=Agaribacterium haliotis TaxID=2013869 RepID=UPI000BB555CD|nr:RNA methyltransferase [Agaribacterium haliotis]